MDAIPFDMAGRDWMIAGRIRAAIRAHVDRLNAQESRGSTRDTLSAPCALPFVNPMPARNEE